MDIMIKNRKSKEVIAEMSELLKLPVGIDNFEKIRKEKFYYVDKTRLIEQILEQWGEVNLFTRPRRFGKTLNMSMLQNFFEIGADKTLFDGLYISGNQTLCEEYMGKFPVIFLSLKGVDGLTFEEARQCFNEMVGREASRFSFLADSEQLTKDEKEMYLALVKICDGEYSMSGMNLGILIVIILLAIFAPVFSKYDFAFTDYSNVYSTPTKEHIFGCDQFGRDLWTRVWMGTRISLMIALVAAVLDLVVGVLYGAVSALLGGRVDALMQRIIEILVGIPSLIIVILFLMAFPAGVGTIIAALSITGWVNMARLVRAEILKLKNQEFVMASHVLGSNNFYIIMKDLIPNTVGIIVIQVMFTIPSAIFTEAFLSFIGIGLAEPQASLGVLINGGYQVLQNYPHVLICPAIVIVLIMVCFSILGDGLRDALDPQMRK